MPPTFETVVVTRQPKTSAGSGGRGGGGGSGGRGGGGGGGGNDEDDDDDDIVSKCDDFERCAAADENGDGLSVHYVEATPVRVLAANTGSVAILGTTAKCKPTAGGGGGGGDTSAASVEQPRPDDPSSEPGGGQLVVETRYVEATAVRTLAAETGSIAILGTTADPKPSAAQVKGDGDDTGSVHYVEATAVRHLAAETGTIAILASTAAVSGTVAGLEPREDEPAAAAAAAMELMPVGVREVLDCAGPGRRETAADDGDGERTTVDDDPRIPLPVIYAMETKPHDGVTSKTKSFSCLTEKRTMPPRSTTTDGVMNLGGGPTATDDDDGFARKPLVRQSNETRRQRGDNGSDDSDDFSVFEGWTVPVFAKCRPAKCKSK